MNLFGQGIKEKLNKTGFRLGIEINVIILQVRCGDLLGSLGAAMTRNKHIKLRKKPANSSVGRHMFFGT